MQSTSVYLIEFYALLIILNAFMGVVTETWQEDKPGDSLRSPFNAFPLGSNFTGLDTTTTTNELISPVNGTGDPIPWYDTIFENFEAMITATLNFVSFFTAGFVLQLFETMGIPQIFWIIITAPIGLYLMYMTFVMITNRLGN
jgi:hypothetical protein